MPVARALNWHRSIWADAKPELVVAKMPVFVLVKEELFTLKTLEVAMEVSVIPVVL